MAYDISVLEFIGVSITSDWYLDLYRVTLCMCSIAFRCSQRGTNVSSNDTRNSMMETKVPDFCFICQGQSSVITAVNSLLTTKGCFIRLSKKQKIVLYLQMIQHTKLCLSFSKASASFLKYS